MPWDFSGPTRFRSELIRECRDTGLIPQHSIRQLSFEGKFDQGRTIAKTQLAIRPWNSSVLRDWSISETKADNIDLACDIQEKIISLFPNEEISDIGCNFSFVNKAAIFPMYRQWLAETVRQRARAAEPDRGWECEDPLPDVFVWKDGVDQVGCGLTHPPSSAASAESAAFAAEGDEHLVVALLALGAQKSVG